jgi:hypothetical protein
MNSIIFRSHGYVSFDRAQREIELFGPFRANINNLCMQIERELPWNMS